MISVKYLDMPTTVRGFVRDSCGDYTIVLNPRMSYEQQQKTYRHELYHIENGDLDRDCDLDQIEAEAHKEV